ncbi:MAG: ABC transporter ATP-binding protein [Myxococcales bacterium]
MNALELRGIVKRFGDVAAVDGVTLSVGAGEVLAVVGENGAGKTTLVGVACGLYLPDAGTVHVLGRELPPGDPRAAIDAGLGAVHQHFMLVPPLRVWENVVLGREPRRLGTLDTARARRQVAEVAQRSGLFLDVDARVDTLSVAAQQRVEIVKQLWRGTRVLILDEPTSVLAPAEIDALLRTVRALAAGGRGVVFISHKLREVLAVADRIAVLRKGRLVQETSASDTSAIQLAEAVTSAETRTSPSPSPSPSTSTATSTGTPTRTAPPTPTPTSTLPARLLVHDLRCEDARGRPALRGLSFQLAASEVLGIAGVDGNGQSELAEVLTGLRRARGVLELDGKNGLEAPGWARDPGAARSSGIVHLPEDRHGRALCLPLTVEENLSLGWQARAPWARGALIDRAGRRRKTEELIAAFRIDPPTALARAADLSGGNQQKLVAARELRGGPPPRLVVAVQPTRGLDVGAARLVQSALRSAAAAGAAVLLISLDLDELRAAADRILVLYDGRAAGEAPPTATDEALGRLMLGQAA